MSPRPGVGILGVVVEFLQHVTETALASPWLLGVLVVMAVLDALLPAVPSEALIIAAGVASAAGQQNLPVVVLAAGLGSFVGESTGYLIGRGFGPAVRRKLAANTTFTMITRLLSTRGGAILLGARFVPGGRTVATLTAGATGFPAHRFFAYTAVGAPLGALYTAVLGYLGGTMFANPVVALLFSLGLATAVTAGAEIVRRLVRRAEARRPGVERPAQERALVGAGNS